MGEHIKFADKPLRPVKGNMGLASQVPGMAATVGNLASATGGITPGNMVATDK